MSTGTYLVQKALAKIGVFSRVLGLDGEELTNGRDLLNGYLQQLLDDDIKIGAVPLNAVGDEFGEAAATTNAIIFNLAIELAPDFENGSVQRVTPALLRNANRSYNKMRANYQKITIPKKVVSATLPLGAGNRVRFFGQQNYFAAGSTLTDDSSSTS